MVDGFCSSRIYGHHIHAIDFLTGNAIGTAAVEEVGVSRGAGDRGAHAVFVVLDDVENRQFPESGHVEGFVDLALIDRTITEIGSAEIVFVFVFVSEAETCANRHLGGDDTVTAEETLVAGEHMHRPALAAGIAAGTTGQFCHHATAFHAGCQHVCMIAITGDDGVTLFHRRLNADHDRFLTNIEMAETSDQTHAIHLSGFFFKTTDQQHFAVVIKQGVFVRPCGFTARG